jgi:hypothetical protein
VWKKPEMFFHCVEKTAKVFPLRGKFAEIFSIVWKTRWAAFVIIAYEMFLGAAAERRVPV